MYGGDLYMLRTPPQGMGPPAQRIASHEPARIVVCVGLGLSPALPPSVTEVMADHHVAALALCLPLRVDSDAHPGQPKMFGRRLHRAAPLRDCESRDAAGSR